MLENMESKDNEELDQYGVWVKTPPRDANTDELQGQDEQDSPMTTKQDEKQETQMQEIQETNEKKEDEFDIEGMPDFSSLDSINAEQAIPQQEPQEEEIDLDAFIEGGVFGEPDEETKAKQEAREKGESVSSIPKEIRQEATKEKEEKQEVAAQGEQESPFSFEETTATPDVSPESPSETSDMLDIDLSFGDEDAAANENDSSQTAQAEQENTSTTQNEGEETVDLADFGVDFSAPQDNKDSHENEQEKQEEKKDTKEEKTTDTLDAMEPKEEQNAQTTDEATSDDIMMPPPVVASDFGISQDEGQNKEIEAGVLDANTSEDNISLDSEEPKGDDIPIEPPQSSSASQDDDFNLDDVLNSIEDVNGQTFDLSGDAKVEEDEQDLSSVAPATAEQEESPLSQEPSMEDTQDIKVQDATQDATIEEQDKEEATQTSPIEQEATQETTIEETPAQETEIEDDMLPTIDETVTEEPSGEIPPVEQNDYAQQEDGQETVVEENREQEKTQESEQPDILQEPTDDSVFDEIQEQQMMPPKDEAIIDNDFLEPVVLDAPQQRQEIQEQEEDAPQQDIKEPVLQESPTQTQEDATQVQQENQADAPSSVHDDVNDTSNQILQQIACELDSLRSQMTSLKQDFEARFETLENSVAKKTQEQQQEQEEDETSDTSLEDIGLPPVPQEQEKSGFFSENEQEDLSLSSDELSNMLSSVELKEEEKVVEPKDTQEDDALALAIDELATEDDAITSLDDIATTDDESLQDENPIESTQEDALHEDIEETLETSEPSQDDMSDVFGATAEPENEENDFDATQEIMEDDLPPEIDLPKQEEEQQESTALDAAIPKDAQEETSELDIEETPQEEEKEEKQNDEPQESVQEDALPQEMADAGVQESKLEEEHPIDVSPKEDEAVNEEPTQEPSKEDASQEVPLEETVPQESCDIAINEEFEPESLSESPLTSSKLDYLQQDSLDETGDLKVQIKNVLSYMDRLLENLPDEKITEFAKSKHFDEYKKLFSQLGLS